MLTTLSHSTQAIAIAESVTDMINLWLYDKSKNTADAYRRDVLEFLTFVGGKELGQVTVNDLQSFANALGANGLKLATVNRKLNAVKSLLTYSHKLGLIPANAGAAVPTRRPQEDVNERILSEPQVMTMIYATPRPVERAMLKLLYATGCRVSELLQLRWCDATDREDAVQLSVLGKGDKLRYIMIHPALWAEVKTATGMTGEYVFCTRSGKPYDRARVHRIVKAAGERVWIPDVSAHWFRHSHASHALDRGCGIHTVQASLGHSSIETTQRYLHARPEDGSGLHLAI
jgi:integrase/recombinase XerD